MNYSFLNGNNKIDSYKSFRDLDLEPRLQEYINEKMYYRSNHIQEPYPLEQKYNISNMDKLVLKRYKQGKKDLYNIENKERKEHKWKGIEDRVQEYKREDINHARETLMFNPFSVGQTDNYMLNDRNLQKIDYSIEGNRLIDPIVMNSNYLRDINKKNSKDIDNSKMYKRNIF